MFKAWLSEDLDRNGFVDVVAVSSLNTPEPYPLFPGIIEYGSPLDDTDFIAPIMGFTPSGLVWNGLDPSSGNLTVELNSGDNGNNWAQITVQGSIGLTSIGVVNRDGIGAVISFTPKNGSTVLKPITAGASFASQHSLEANFGLGTTNSAQMDVLWPGGVRNRLYEIKKSERILFPEIPCTIDANAWVNLQAYKSCVKNALDELVSGQVISIAR